MDVESAKNDSFLSYYKTIKCENIFEWIENVDLENVILVAENIKWKREKMSDLSAKGRHKIFFFYFIWLISIIQGVGVGGGGSWG